MGDIEFASAETYPFADQIFRLVRGGYISAVSVGFKPVDWDFAKEPSRMGGIDFKRQELLEISVTPIPANQNALIEARAKGLWPTARAHRESRASRMRRAAALINDVGMTLLRTAESDGEIDQALRMLRDAGRL
jgi:HK97 family phage prohead protease